VQSEHRTGEAGSARLRGHCAFHLSDRGEDACGACFLVFAWVELKNATTGTYFCSKEISGI